MDTQDAQIQTAQRMQNRLVWFLLAALLALLTAVAALAYLPIPATGTPLVLAAGGVAVVWGVLRQRRLRALQKELWESLGAKDRAMGRLGDRLREQSARSAELDTRLRDLTRLYRAISAVNSAEDHRTVYDVVVDAARHLVDADTGSLMLLDEARQTLVLRAAYGLQDTVVAAGVERRIGEGVAGWVAQNAKPVLLVGDARSDGRFENTVPDTGIDLSLCVPLLHGRTVLGVLNLGISHRLTPGDSQERRLGASHESMASIFAQHAAVAVMNARLLDQMGR